MVIRRLVILGFCILVSSSCTVSHNEKRPTEYSGNYIECVQIRPEMCAQVFEPVCAKLGALNWKTYSNACRACADRNVIGFTTAPCEKNN